MRTLRILAACAIGLAGLAACGEDPSPAGQDRPNAPAGRDGGACPISAEELSAITGIQFELAEQRDNEPVLRVQSVNAKVCLYTGPVGSDGDPAVFRVDTVSSADAGAVRAMFSRACKPPRGSVRPVPGADRAQACQEKVGTIDGIVKDGEILAYLVAADEDVTKKLAPKFDQILAAVGR